MGHRSRKAKRPQVAIKKQFADLSSLWLALLGSASFVVAGYWGLLLGKVLPDYIEAVNSHGFSPLAIALAVIFAGLGSAVWWQGAISYRCNELLFERHFR